MTHQTNIKVGDFVAIIRNGVHYKHEYKIGETYEVYKITGTHAWVYADATRNKDNYFLLIIDDCTSTPECELYISPFTSNCSFKIGDVVKIAQTSEYFCDDDPFNPINILGTITTIKPENNDTGLVIMVKWDTNKTNSYQEIDLVYVSAPPSSPSSVPENTLSSFKEGDWIEFSSYSKRKDIDNIIQIHSINDNCCTGQPWILRGRCQSSGSWDISGMFNIRKIDVSDEKIQKTLPDNSPYLIITPPPPTFSRNASYKVGDMVMVTEDVQGNKAKIGTIGLLSKIDVDHVLPYQLNLGDDVSWCKNVRHLTPKEYALKTPSSSIIDYDGWRIGDELIDDDLHGWDRAEGDNRWNNGWKKGTGFFSGNRKIEKIDVKDGAIAFLISGTLNIWMRADGYRNFISSCKASSSNIPPLDPYRVQKEEYDFQIGDWVEAQETTKWWKKGDVGLVTNTESGQFFFITEGNTWCSSNTSFKRIVPPSVYKQLKKVNLLTFAPVKPTEHLEFQTPIIMKKPNKKRKLITINN